MKTTLQRDLLLVIDSESKVPLHAQVERQLRSAVQTGRLVSNTRLPSTRLLAKDLGISRGAVVTAYEQLIEEGYFISVGGSGTRVGRIRSEPPNAPALEDSTPTAARFDFEPGVPDLTSFPRAAWMSSLRRAIRDAPASDFGYPKHRGPLMTRQALASYLARTRATVGQSDQFVLSAGFTHAMNLVARLLKDRNVQRVAIENPGFGNLHRVFAAVGISTELIPVDDDGLMVERVIESDPEAVVVTPAHQFPTGATLSAARRVALLEWAEQRNALIIEDDYDSELRFDRPPLGALQGLAPHRVIYLGTTSKSLCPALRLGWTLAPTDVSKNLARLKGQSSGGSPTIDQLALGEFIHSGAYDRHIRTMRSAYRLRHYAIKAALRKYLPSLRAQGIPAGLHVMLSLPPSCDETAVIDAGRAVSIDLYGVKRFWMAPHAPAPALVLGFGLLDIANVDEAVAELATIVLRESTRNQHANGLDQRVPSEPS